MKPVIFKFLIVPFMLFGQFTFSQDTIVIGVDNNYPPYEFVDDKGAPVGFNIDITTRILKDYGYEYRIVANPWDVTYKLFKDHKVDVISMLYSEERNTQYYLSIPHNQVTYGVFYNKENHDLIESFDYKEGIVVIKDDVMHELLLSQQMGDNVMAVESSEEALKWINKDVTRIALLPKVQSMYLINKHKFDNIELSEKFFYTQKYCFAVDKSRQDLIFALNEGLPLLKEKKVYDRLLQKWFSPLEQTKTPFSKVVEDYLLILLLIGIFFLIVVFWNLTLKRAINKRNKELKEELQARERSEMAIIESEERFRTLTENSPAAIIIFNQRKIFFVNNAATQMTLFSKEEMHKMSFFEFLQDDKEKQYISDFFLQAKKNKVSSFKKDILLKNRKGAQLWVNVSVVKSYYKAEPVIIATAFDITDRHFYEQEIVESKRMFGTLLDNLPGMVYQCENDKDWTMFFISDGCLALTEYTPDELLYNKNSSYNEIIYADDRNYVWDTIQKSIARKTPFTLEYRITTKSGTVKWVWEQGRLIQKNQKIFLEGYITDITERVFSRHTLVKERIKYETMLHSIGDGVIGTDTNGFITMMNFAAEKLTGWKSPDALGKPLEDVFVIVNEDTREVCENPYKKVLETGSVIGLANHTLMISKEGKEFIISDSAAPIKNDEGVVTGVIIVFSDNTANRRAEDAIKESESKLKATFNAIPDLIFRNDSEGNFTDFHIGSDKKLLIEPDKIIGVNVKDLFDEATALKILNSIKLCLETSEPQNLEYSIREADNIFYYDAKIVRFNQNEVLSLCRDVTLKKLAEEEIKKSQKNYKKLFDTANDVIFILKQDIIVNCNKKTAETFGYSKDEIIGKTPVFVSPEFQPDGTLSSDKARMLIERAYSGETLTFEWDHRNKDGRIIKCEISLNKIEFASENLLQAIVRDISERKQYEAALKESEEKYKILVEKANDGIAIVQDNIFIFGNKKLCELAGYSHDELIGKPFMEFVHDSFKEQILKYNKARLQKIDGIPNIYEIIAIHRSGKLLNMELNSNYINYNGKPAALVVIRDISERKLTEQKLNIFKATIENSTDAIGMTTAEGVHYYQNAAFDRLFGDLSGVDIATVYKNEEDKIEVFDTIMKGKQYISEIEMFSKEGEPLNVLLRAYPVFDDTGNITSLVGIHTDITLRKQAEKALQISEEKTRMLIDLAADAFFHGDSEGYLIYVNEKAIELTGYSREELLQMHLSDLFHPDELKSKPLQYMKLEEGKVLKNERNIKTKDGQYIAVEMNSRKMPDSTYQSFFRNITERKLAEEKLRQSEEKYRLLFENISQGFALHDIILDEEGKPCDYRYVTVNPAFGKLTGIDISIIKGKRIKELLPSIEPYWIERFGKVALDGEPIHYENYAADLERYYDTWVFSPQKGQFAVIFSDITERKMSENAINSLLTLSQSGDKSLQEITDYALNECVNLTRSEIAFLAFTNDNLSQITLNSFSKDVFVGDKYKDQSLTLELNDNSLFAKAIRTRKAVWVNKYDEHLLKKELPHWHMKIEKVLIVPIEDNNKTVALATVANKKGNYSEKDAHQITLIVDRLWKTVQSKRYNDSIQKLNTELVEKNKEMEQFVYVTSHDLRSPLVNIQGFTKVLADNCLSIKESLSEEISYTDFKNKIISQFKEDIDESLKYIELSTRKMDALLNGLLKLSRMGRIVPNVKNVDMNMLVKDVVNSFEFQIMKKNIQVHISDLHDCMADEALTSQVFSNLLDNAIKYNDKKIPTIKISSRKEKNKVIYCIEDNGPGIPEKYYSKVFEIFQRLNASVSGEGLGLSIVNKIIEKHNGRIWIESVVNKGTKFFIEI